MRIGKGFDLNPNIFISRFSSLFKKGYPHGPAVLTYPNNTAAWTGRFSNGVARGEAAPEDIKQLFTIFTDQPFRSNVKLSNI